MQRKLFVFILMGQCSFITCQLHDYYFIKENKTWDEAQTYCREKYTDLATVSNMTDMKRLIDSAQSQDEAWIENKTNWAMGQPDDNQGHFENSNKTCHVIDYLMTWPQAQNYCRENHTDLIICINMWIGLFRDTWRWSDGSNSSFRYWESLSNNDMVDGESDKTCATTVLNRAGRWSFDYCSNKKPFICYDAPVKQHLVEMTLRVDDPTVDMKDPAVAEALLKQWKFIYHSVSDRVAAPVKQHLVEVTLRVDDPTVDMKDPAVAEALLKQWKIIYHSVSDRVAAPLKQHLVEMTLRVDDPTVDMKDPAVAEALLKQLEQKFREKGVSVKLSWRKLPEKQNTCPEIDKV
ncbi:hypothetical protein Q5P01_002524 [Channa striata]|uniref:C-type lectin domain-containing protein n=1 Tax=Channa striata TaxID=64152 RepID=A0AA88NSW7_CHASR|nr:hypothetical protein Q5P01_002524 [Channa striata]